jgi:hypothetical protein
MKNKLLTIILLFLCALTLGLILPDVIMGDDEPEPITKTTEKYVSNGSDTLGNGEEIMGTDGISIRTNGKDMNIGDYITMKMEYAYHEGQKDFMKGDIRIDSSLKWTKSPWDDKDINKLLYKP